MNSQNKDVRLFDIPKALREKLETTFASLSLKPASANGVDLKYMSSCAYCTSGCANNCYNSCEGSCHGGCSGSCSHYSR